MRRSGLCCLSVRRACRRRPTPKVQDTEGKGVKADLAHSRGLSRRVVRSRKRCYRPS